MAFVYDTKAQRYRKKNGKFVSHKEIEKLTQQYLLALANDFSRIANTIESDFEAFQQEAIDLIRYSHLHQYFLGRGGIKHMQPDDWRAIAGERNYQYGRFKRMAQQVADGEVSAAQAKFRLRMYAESSKASYWLGKMNGAIAAGLSEARNILGAAEHCPDCVRLTGLGWVPIPDMPPPTKERVCGPFCYCSLEFK